MSLSLFPAAFRPWKASGAATAWDLLGRQSLVWNPRGARLGPCRGCAWRVSSPHPEVLPFGAGSMPSISEELVEVCKQLAHVPKDSLQGSSFSPAVSFSPSALHPVTTTLPESPPGQLPPGAPPCHPLSTGPPSPTLSVTALSIFAAFVLLRSQCHWPVGKFLPHYHPTGPPSHLRPDTVRRREGSHHCRYLVHDSHRRILREGNDRPPDKKRSLRCGLSLPGT